MTDEIMMEVHAIKDAIGAKYGNNLEALFKEIQLGEGQAEGGRRQGFGSPRQSNKFACHCIATDSLRSPLNFNR